MKPYELARLIHAYYASTTEPTVLGFAEWLQSLDTSDNQYRYKTETTNV